MAAGPLVRHCRRRGCPCSHEHCDHGWVDVLDGKGNTVGTRPCVHCREDLAAAVSDVPDPTDRSTFRRALAAHAGYRPPLY